MSGIDQVIARARCASDADFSERRQFKLARRRAIEKMRRFALADPYFYILELIQAAIAGGADYVDISYADEGVTVSWTGGSPVRAEELAQLFDFLFASKSRMDIAHVRSLALGINALMLFEPETIVVESGDGTEGGTARMVIRHGADEVDVGKTSGTLNGTYLRASKLDRDKVQAETGREGDSQGGREFGTVETRCLAAPVPLMFNGQPVFGWSRQRIPNLFGYNKTLSFDEGDLYGTLGLDSPGEPSFQLLTHGVWVQSYQHTLVPKHNIGGIICFDALRKTADHSGFVRDERFEELWLRLRPYAEALAGGRRVEQPKITGLNGLELAPNELRLFLRENPRVIALPPAPTGGRPGKRGNRNRNRNRNRKNMGAGDPERERALAKAAKLMSWALDATLLRIPPEQLPAVRILGGRDLCLWQPSVDDGGAELAFYTQAEHPEPARPHLFPAVALEPRAVEALVDEMVSAGRVGGGKRPRSRLLRALGTAGVITARLFTPLDPGPAARGLLVEVTTTGRRLGSRVFASAYLGRVLQVELPTASPTRCRAALGGDENEDAQPVFALVAERYAALCEPVLQARDQRILGGLGVGKIEAGSRAATTALRVLARVSLTRLRSARPGRLRPGLSFSLLRPLSTFDPFALSLLRTLSGRALSLRELALLSDLTAGLVYGCVPTVEADLEGLDRDRVLALDVVQERALIGLLGESGYVRIDARDVLARHGGLAVRDVAVGLRTYPEFDDFPLLVEGEVEALAELGASGRAAALEALVGALCARVCDEQAPSLGAGGAAGATAKETIEEHRRQAVRHLQWAACRGFALGLDSPCMVELFELPLFLDLDGRAWALRQVVAGLRAPGGLRVHYVEGLGGSELGVLAEAVAAHGERPKPADAGEWPRALGISAFVFRLLAPLGRVRLAFDFDLDDAEAAHNPATASQAFLIRESFEGSWGQAVLGIPATVQDEYRVQIRSGDGVVRGAVHELGRRYGLVGVLTLRADLDEAGSDALTQSLDARGGALLERLLARLPEFGDDPGRWRAAVQVLLNYASSQLVTFADDRGLGIDVGTALAAQILAEPLFDTGKSTLVSGQRVLESFRAHVEAAPSPREAGRLDWRAAMAEGTPGFILAWLDAHLQPANVVMVAASRSERSAEPEPEPESESESESDSESDSESWTVWIPGDPRALSGPDVAWNLAHWLAALRPDPRTFSGTSEGRAWTRTLQPTRVWISEYGLPDTHLCEGGDTRLDISSEHPALVELARAPSTEALAWALLGIYAHLNDVSGPITNAHETRFQRTVLESLTSGALELRIPDPKALFRR